MGQHVIQAPDGSQHIIEAPDDAEAHDILNFASQIIPAYQGGFGAATPDPAPGTQAYYDSFAGGPSNPDTVVPTDAGDARSFALTRPKSQPTPDAPTWLGRRLQDIEGRQDPNFADTPTVYSENKNLLEGPMGTAATLGASDEQMADIVKKQLGDRYLGASQDANGYSLIHFKGDNGQPQVGYLNKPGLDSEDIVRGVRGSLPYLLLGGATGAAAKGLMLPLRAAAQGLTAAATSVLGDKAQEPLGSEEGVDAPKAATMGLLGAGGELLGAGASALYQKFIAIPRYFNKAIGELTNEGRAAAQRMGLDPATMASNVKQEFAKAYAANPADAQNLIDSRVSDAEFNIPSTVGQRTKDPQQLMLEKNLRYGLQGLEAKTIMQSLDQSQNDAVDTSVRQTIPSRLTGTQLRLPDNFTQADFGSRIVGGVQDAQAAAKRAERAAWEQTGPLTAKTAPIQVPDAMTPMTGATRTASTSPAMPLLNDELKQNLAPFANVINSENTPVGFKMWSYLNDFMRGKKPSSVLHDALGLEGSNDIDSVRKAIGLMSKDAATPTDRAVSGAIYKSFNDWTGKAADQGLLNGDMQSVAQFRNARDISRQMNEIFKPSQGSRLTPGGKLLEQIQASADTPERVVSALFTGPKADVKAGAVEALQKMKAGFQRYLPTDQARVAWNDIRLAHWTKMTQGPTGDLLGYQALKANLESMLNKQGSLISTLYSPGEIAQIKRFIGQLGKITYKDPNPSGTASGLGVMARQFVGKILDAVPFARTAFEYTGVPERYAASVAKKAVAQSVAAKPQSNFLVAPVTNALAQPYARSANN